MIERLKYYLNGVYRCENFAEHARQNNFPRVPIGSAGGFDGWYIILRILEGSNPPVVYPLIGCDNKPTLLLRRFFSVFKKDGSSCFKKQCCFSTDSELGPVGHDMCIMDLLNEENGYLDDDGGLTVEYGIHVDAILGKDNIWEFNFYDKVFNPNQNWMIRLGSDGIWKHERLCDQKYVTYNYENLHTGQKRSFHCHKQIVKLHSPYSAPSDSIKIWADWETTDILEKCLQIAHGVRLDIYSRDTPRVLEMAQELNFPNVVKYCEQKFIEQYQGCPYWWFFWDKALRFNSKFILSYVFRNNPLEVFKDVMKKDANIEKMSGEVMKTIVAKIFKEGFRTF